MLVDVHVWNPRTKVKDSAVRNLIRVSERAPGKITAARGCLSQAKK